jgi:hypothetical protein
VTVVVISPCFRINAFAKGFLFLAVLFSAANAASTFLLDPSAPCGMYEITKAPRYYARGLL